MQVRRFVTETVDAKAGFASVDTLESSSPPLFGNEIVRIWGFEEPPTIPTAAEGLGPASPFFPAPGGLRIAKWTLPPASDDPAPVRSPEEEAEAYRASDAVAPGMFDLEYGADGTHQTDSVDVQLILSGRVKLIIGDEIRELAAGDVAIINGDPHAWVNAYDDDCVLYGVYYGVKKT
jgi:quercetin dioxygenase-like cupin family protein